jgi:hypothetical protein
VRTIAECARAKRPPAGKRGAGDAESLEGWALVEVAHASGWLGRLGARAEEGCVLLSQAGKEWGGAASMALVAAAVALLRAGGVGARGGWALSAVGERLHASGVLSGSAAATLVREASSILAPARASLAGPQAGQQGPAGGRSDRADGRAGAGEAESAQEAAAVREGLAAGVQEGLARLLAEMPPLPSLEDDSGEEAAADGGVGAGAGRGAPGEQEGGGAALERWRELPGRGGAAHQRSGSNNAAAGAASAGPSPAVGAWGGAGWYLDLLSSLHSSGQSPGPVVSLVRTRPEPLLLRPAAQCLMLVRLQRAGRAVWLRGTELGGAAAGRALRGARRAGNIGKGAAAAAGDAAPAAWSP